MKTFLNDAVAALRGCGHDVAWIRTESPGSRDEEILARTVSEERILITFDKDFGELAFRKRLPAPCGIILFRVPMLSSTHVARMVVRAVALRDDWAGHFAVVEESRIRMRALPQNRSGASYKTPPPEEVLVLLAQAEERVEADTELDQVLSALGFGG